MFKFFAEIWINDVVTATCEPSTLSDYRGILKNHVLLVFGKQEITKIKKKDVKAFIRKKFNEGYTHSTISHHKDVLSGVFNVAIEDDIIENNPALDLGKRIIKKKKKVEVVILEYKELLEFLELFNRNKPEYWHIVFTLALSGVRIGECLALQWRDIDFEKRTLHVRKQFYKGELKNYTKNKKDRIVDIPVRLTHISHPFQ